MRGSVHKQLSKLIVPRKWSASNNKEKSFTIDCSRENTAEHIVKQLRDLSLGRNNITKLVLHDMLQRKDNVQLFSTIQSLLLKPTKTFCVRTILLVEPHVHGQDYRRWCYKKTNFLHHVYKGAKALGIDVKIDGTLILEEDPQDLASLLSLLEQLPQDSDIKSLWLSIEDLPTLAPPVRLTAPIRRPSMLELQKSPVQKVFSALVELFNSDRRRWKYIHCHVIYAEGNFRDVTIQEEQTKSLLEVAELYNIPLKVQWQPKSIYGNGDNSSSNNDSARKTITHTPSSPGVRMKKQPSQKTHVGNFKEDDSVTASTDCESSSAALMTSSYRKQYCP